MLEKRYGSLEYRADAGRVVGVAMRYGSVATIGGQFSERFEAGAFGDVAALDCLCRLQHERSSPIGRTGGGGLELLDSAAELRVELALPATTQGRDAAELLRLRILRGWSVEFRAEQERFEAGTRIVERARLDAVGLVDKPAYDDSLATIAKRCRGGLEGRGEQLAAVLNAAIPDSDRADLVGRLATAAGISESTVNQILSAQVNAPPLRRLRGFARVLGIPLARLVAAAEQDGGQYDRSTKPSEATLWL